MENDYASPCSLMHGHYNRLSAESHDSHRRRRAASRSREKDINAFEIAGMNSTNPSNTKPALLRAARLAKGRWHHD
jgi:hypothetical protein